MKLPQIALFLILGISTLHAQKVPFEKQAFAIPSVRMEENFRPFQSELKFSFKIYGKYRRDEIQAETGRQFPSYQLRFWATDEKGDTLVPPDAHTSLKQNFSFFDVDTGAYHSYSFGHSVQLPFAAFRKSGNVRFVLWAQPESNPSGHTKLAPFKVGTYTVVIPKTVPLETQKIALSHVTANENTSTNNLSLSFDARFNYSIEELGSDKEFSDKVFFYVDFTDEKGNPIHIPNDIKLQAAKENSTKYPSLSHQKNSIRTCTINVPYTDLFLEQGAHNIHYTIHAVSYSQSVYWHNLAQGEMRIQMPPVYFTKIRVDSVHIKQGGSYDVSAKSVPIIGLFVPKKGNAGKGYPDVFWTLTSGKKTLLTTSIFNNSFIGPTDSCTFQMLENDALTLKVYDYDVLSRNDYLGSMQLPKLNGETTYQGVLKNGNVESMRIFLKRQARPKASDIELGIRLGDQGGISGYMIAGKIAATENSQTSLFIRTADGENRNLNGVNTKRNDSETFSYFIPAWELPFGAGVGILTTDSYYRLPISQKYITPTHYLQETEDVKLNLATLNPSDQKGIKGLTLKLSAEYPEALSDKSPCSFHYELRSTNGADLKPLLYDAEISNALICKDQVCEMELFVPFSKLASYSESMLSALFTGQIRIQDKFTIGKTTDTLQISVPKLIQSPKLHVSTELKLAKKWSYADVVAVYGNTQKTVLKQVSESGKLDFDFSFPSDYVCEDDVVSLLIIPYEFRTAQTPIRWDIPVKDLHGKLTLPKRKNSKKTSLSVY